MGYGVLPDCEVLDTCWARDNPDRADEVYETEGVLNADDPSDIPLNLAAGDNAVPRVVILCNVCLENLSKGRCTVCNRACIDDHHVVGDIHVCEFCISDMLSEDALSISVGFRTYLQKKARKRLRGTPPDLSELTKITKQYVALQEQRSREEEDAKNEELRSTKRRFEELGIREATATKLSRLLPAGTYASIDDVLEACISR